MSDPSVDDNYKQNSAGAWVNVFDETPYNGPGFTDGYATSDSGLKRQSEVIREDNSWSSNKKLSLFSSAFSLLGQGRLPPPDLAKLPSLLYP